MFSALNSSWIGPARLCAGTCASANAFISEMLVSSTGAGPALSELARGVEATQIDGLRRAASCRVGPGNEEGATAWEGRPTGQLPPTAPAEMGGKTAAGAGRAGPPL